MVYRKAGKHFSAFIKFDLEYSLLLDKDWLLFTQMRFAVTQLLVDTVVGDSSEFIAIKAIEPYGRYVLEDAHHARRFTPEQSTFPTKEGNGGHVQVIQRPFSRK